MTDSYLQTKKQREAYEEQKGEIVFGLLGGTVLLLAGILNTWPIRGIFGLTDIICLVIIFAGICFVLLGIAAPALLKYPYKGFIFIGEKIGEEVLLIILSLIYLVLIIPVGLIMRKKRKSLGFFTWSGEFPYKEKTFEEITESGSKDIDTTIKSSFLRNIYKLFGTFIRNKSFFLVPAAVILVLLGLILFFAASNIVFNFFIYTLF